MPTCPNSLLVLAYGIGESNYSALRSGAGLPEYSQRINGSAEDPAELLSGEADATAMLGDLGVAIDRRSMTLRSHTDCDDAVIAALSRRPTGVAHATILELRSVLEAGTIAGLAAVPAAIERLAQLVRGAAARVRAGDATEVWLLGSGELVPVRATFDVAAALAGSRAAPPIAELRPRIEPGRVTLRPTSRWGHDRALELLRGPVFREHGSVVSAWSGLAFVAAADVAFGRRRVAARAPNPGERQMVALLPHAPRNAEETSDLRSLIARFWMRAAAHADLRTAVPASNFDAAAVSVDSVHSPLIEPAGAPTELPTR